MQTRVGSPSSVKVPEETDTNRLLLSRSCWAVYSFNGYLAPVQSYFTRSGRFYALSHCKLCQLKKRVNCVDALVISSLWLTEFSAGFADCSGLLIHTE
jgi:hypothetical protein